MKGVERILIAARSSFLACESDEISATSNASDTLKLKNAD